MTSLFCQQPHSRVTDSDFVLSLVDGERVVIPAEHTTTTTLHGPTNTRRVNREPEDAFTVGDTRDIGARVHQSILIIFMVMNFRYRQFCGRLKVSRARDISSIDRGISLRLFFYLLHVQKSTTRSSSPLYSMKMSRLVEIRLNKFQNHMNSYCYNINASK